MYHRSTFCLLSLCLVLSAAMLPACQSPEREDSGYVFLAVEDFPDTAAASLGRAADVVIPAQNLRIRQVFRTRDRILYQLLTTRLEELELAIEATGRYSSHVEILGKRYNEEDEARELLDGLKAQLAAEER